MCGKSSVGLSGVPGLFKRLVGILHGCLKSGTTYDEHTAWDHLTKAPA